MNDEKVRELALKIEEYARKLVEQALATPAEPLTVYFEEPPTQGDNMAYIYKRDKYHWPSPPEGEPWNAKAFVIQDYRDKFKLYEPEVTDDNIQMRIGGFERCVRIAQRAYEVGRAQAGAGVEPQK